MKKKKLFILALIPVVSAALLTSCSCADNKPETSPSKESETIKYSVTFNSNGGSTVAQISNVESGTKITKPADPTKEGYQFQGWYKDSALTAAFDFNTGITSNIILYAKWVEVSVDKFTVSFNTNGGSEILDQVNIESGRLATTPTNPTKNGYTFVGWYMDSALTTAFDFNTPITSNITLYAKWNEVSVDKYTVSFETNGGTAIISITDIVSHSKITEPTDPTKEGYTFGGWYTDSLTTAPYDFEAGVTGNITLYAKWIPNTYIVTFNSNGGSTVKQQTIEHGSKAETPVVPTKAGYQFVCWHLQGVEDAFDFDTAITSNITLVATWNEIAREKRVVTLEANGGVIGYPSINVDYDTKLSEASMPIISKEGYTFQGWYSDQELNTLFDFDTSIKSNITLYAKWSINTYEITFNSNDGSNVDNQTINYNGLITEPSNPTKEGYTFGGWYTDITLESPYNFSTPVTSSFTLYAKWTLVSHDKHSVSFDSNGGTDVITQANIDSGGYATLPTTPTKEGYTFVGWYTDTALETAYNFATPVTSSFTLYAKWTVSKFTVTFKTYAGDTLYQTTVEYNKDATYVGDTPTKEGFTFDGWDKKLTGIKETTIIYAKFLHPIFDFSDNEQTKISAVKDKNITSATIPSGITEIGDGAFYSCEKLESVVIPDSVTVIGEEAFSSCYTLTSINIPSGITEIGAGAFSYCAKLSSITLPEGITEISEYLFAGCRSLTSFSVPSTVTSIKKQAFYDTGLETFTIPATVTEIEEEVFVVCKSLMSVNIPTGITEIPYRLFSGCSSLNNVVIPSTVTTIGGSAFYQCSSLTNITLGDNVKLIESQAFYICPLKSIVLPASLEEIEAQAFFANYSLLEIYNLSSLALTIGSNDNGYVAKYAKVTHTSLTEDSIYRTIDGFNYAHFDDTYYLTGATNITPTMTFPSSFEWNGVEITEYEIYKSAFENNQVIKELIFQSGLKTIGISAFSGCTNLRKVVLPSGLTTISSSAFGSCPALLEVYNLSSLYLGKGTTSNGSIAYKALVIHNSLEQQSIYVKDSAGYVFAHYLDKNYLVCYEGDELELTLPSSFTYNSDEYTSYMINSYAFAGSDITKVTIPSSVTNIGTAAFRLCQKLKDITINPGVTEIASYAFYSCPFESIEIPNTVTVLDEIFPCCYSLKSVILPNTITTIKTNAFRLCDSLSAVYFKGTKAEWDAIAITEDGNSTLTSEATTKYFYSENTPTVEGNYWHYVEGVITIWE